MFGRLCAQFAVLGTLLLSSLPALGNGRFPRAQRLLEQPGNPDRLVLAATYGLLVTEDRGRSWSYVCESSFTHLDSYTGDPLVDFTGDLSLLVNVQGSISVSGADACDWKQTLSSGDDFFVDHSVSKSNPAWIIAAVVHPSPEGSTNELRLSRDNGRSWDPIGSPLPLAVMYTIDIDPLDPDHLYATGIQDDVGQLVTSTDQGKTWTLHPIANTDATEIPYLAGIHPHNPQELFVRTDSSRSTGDTSGGDALLYSNDGGGSFREVFRGGAKLLGFALAPDGSSVLIGFGNPVLTGASPVPGAVGVFKSSTETFSFEQVYGGNVNCLTWTGTGVYVCSEETRDGFELGFSPVSDFRQDGGCLLPLLHRTEVGGPVTCEPPASAAVCKSAWATDCIPLGACSQGGAASRTECLPFTPPSLSSDSAGATASGGSAAAPPVNSGPPGSGGCRIGSGRIGSTAAIGNQLLWLALSAACVARGRRRRQRAVLRP